ncbi:MAG: HAD-IA family hydrolase [Candidatus Gracilibacteria bacterium]
MATTEVIIFDVDGTLLNTDEVHFQLLRSVLLKLGISINEEFYGKNGLDDSVFSVGLSEEEVDAVKEKIRKTYYSDTILPKLKLKQGALDIIQNLAGKYKLAIGSGEKKEQIQRYLDHFKLNKFFEFIGHGQMVPMRKSNPLYFQTIADFFKVKTENCLMVGDSPHDARASDVGCKTVIIPSRFTQYLTFDERCHIMTSLEDLLKIKKH